MPLLRNLSLDIATDPDDCEGADEEDDCSTHTDSTRVPAESVMALVHVNSDW